MNWRRHLFLAACALLHPFYVQSQGLWVNGKETVVTGQLQKEVLADVLPSITVITQEEIRRTPARDLFDLLNGLPGLEATRVGPMGNPISVSMRGASSAQTLILVDGMPFSAQGAIGASSPLEAIPLAIVNRVEILRGNASAQYGPGAVGGVIQILTKPAFNRDEADGLKSGASMSLGRFGEHQVGANLSAKSGSTQWHISTGKTESRGYDALRPNIYSTGGFKANPGPNGHAQEFYQLSVDHDLNPLTEVGFSAAHTRLNAQFDNAYSFNAPDVWEGKTEVNFLKLHLKRRMSEDWLSKLQYSESQNNQSTFTNGVFNLSYGSFNTRFKTWNWDNTYALTDQHMLTFGATSSKIQLNARHTGFAYIGPNPDDYGEIPVNLTPTLNTSRVFAGLSSQIGQWNGQLTLSHEQLGQSNHSDNFIVGMGYQIAKGYKLTATRSSATLAPTVGQRFDPSYGGNPGLLPERSFSEEWGVQKQSETWSWRLVSFKVNYQNLISSGSNLVSDPFWRDQGVYQLENVGQARNKGIEWGSSWRNGRWAWGLSLTWQNPENLQTEIRPINKAKRYGSLRASYDLDPVTRFTWMTYFSGDRLTLAPGDSSVSPSRTSGYVVHHLAAEKNFTPSWIGKFSLLNVFDKQYSPVAGYAPQPRSWLLTLSHQIQ